MKREVMTKGFLMAMIIIASQTYSFSQDWPQFRGINRDCVVTGFTAPRAWPSELTQVWKVSVGTGDATPVLVGKKIFLHTRQGGDEVIQCLDASTGKELWKNSYAVTAVTGPAASHPGPRSTPAVANGKIVTFGVSGIVSCLDANTGKVIWRKENPANDVPQFFTGMSPLVIDGLCIVHVGKKDNGTLLVLDLTTGNEKWKWAGDGPAYASPSIMMIDGKKHVIVQTEKNLLSFDLADGKINWQIATPFQQRFYNSSSPCINNQTIYYTGQGSGMKAVKIEKQDDQYTVKELWDNPATGAKWNTPVLKNGFLYGFTDTKKAYCINAADGQTVWTDTNPTSDFATLVDCGSLLIGMPSTGPLLVLKPDNKAYSEVTRYKVSETAVYSFPVVAGSNIYIKDAENLMMYKF
jgi:outer membrane protein assembly factor BamB